MKPSKKVIGIFILTAALVFSVIIVFGKDKTTNAVNFANNLVSGEKIDIPENTNWQNELNKISNSVNLPNLNGASSTESTTDALSISLISNYLSLKQSNNWNTNSFNTLIGQTLDYASTSNSYYVNSLGKEKAQKDLSVIPDNGLLSVENYGENLGNIFKNNQPKENASELVLLAKAIDSRDPLKMKEIANSIAVYEKINGELLKMPVPQKFVKMHLKMVNGMSEAVNGLKGLTNVLEDPAKGLASMQLFASGSSKFIEALEAIDLYLNTMGITYKQGSGGYYLMYGI